MSRLIVALIANFDQIFLIGTTPTGGFASSSGTFESGSDLGWLGTPDTQQFSNR
jgi:hypothetical protein